MERPILAWFRCPLALTAELAFAVCESVLERIDLPHIHGVIKAGRLLHEQP